MQHRNRDSTGNNGSTAGGTDKDKDSHSSLTPSPRMSGEDVKSEPMELVCGPGGIGGQGGQGAGAGNHNSTNNLLAHDDHSNDSVNEINHSSSNAEIKGHLR